MAAVRPEPFQLALQSLRDQLRDGVYPPGARITATEVSDRLGLSPTPVREALARLSGEGLLEDRRGQGVFVRHLTAADIADLYRLSLAHLLIAQDPQRPQLTRRAAPEGGEEPAGGPADPVRNVERLFAAWVAEGAGRVLASAHHLLQVQLGPVRRIEPLLMPDLAEEARALEAVDGPAAAADRLHRIRQFHVRRVRLADRLATQLAGRGRPPEYSADIV
jgi:hypothetical protein